MHANQSAMDDLSVVLYGVSSDTKAIGIAAVDVIVCGGGFGVCVCNANNECSYGFEVGLCDLPLSRCSRCPANGTRAQYNSLCIDSFYCIVNQYELFDAMAANRSFCNPYILRQWLPIIYVCGREQSVLIVGMSKITN